MFVVISLLIILILVIFKSTKKPKNYPPGPRFYPLIGNYPQIKNLTKKYGGLHFAVDKLAQKYKTHILGLKLGAEYTVVATGFHTIKRILTDEAFDGRPKNFFIRLRSSNKGITGTDGDLSATLRKFTVKHMKFLGFGGSTMNLYIKNEAEVLVTSIKNCEGQLSLFLAPSVLNVLWKIVAGSELKHDAKVDKLLKLFHKRSKSFDMAGGLLNLMPWLRFILPEYTGYNLIVRINKELHEMMNEIISDHYLKWYKGRNDDFIYSFMSEAHDNKDDSKFLTDDNLSMVCLDLFIGGSQTTSTSLEYAFLTMLHFPQIQEKVHEILDAVFPKGSSVAYSDRIKVPYIEAVLYETQRYHNIVPIIGPRRALKDVIVDGYMIKKDTTVLINTHTVLKNDEYWNDPEKFCPERFLDEDGNLKHIEHLITFGLGKRRCPNEILARTCIFVFFCEIMRNYKIVKNSKNGEIGRAHV